MVFFSSRISPRTSTVILRAEIAVRDGRCDLRNVPDLRGQIARHGIDAFRQIFPGTRDAVHIGLSAELPSVPTSRATRVTSLAKDES